jgi:hypothetical protein
MSGISPILRQNNIGYENPRKLVRFKKSLKKIENFNPTQTDLNNIILRNVLQNPNLCVYHHTIPIFAQYYYDKDETSEETVKFNFASNMFEYISFQKENLKYQVFTRVAKKFSEFMRRYQKAINNSYNFGEQCQGSVIVFPIMVYFYDKDKKGRLQFIGNNFTTLIIDKINKTSVYFDSIKSFPKKGKKVEGGIVKGSLQLNDFYTKLNNIQYQILGYYYPAIGKLISTPQFVSTQKLQSIWNIFVMDILLRYYRLKIEEGKLKTIDFNKTVYSLYSKYNTEFKLELLLKQYTVYLIKIKEQINPNKGFVESLQSIVDSLT